MLLSQTNGSLLNRCASVSDTVKHLHDAGFSCMDVSFFYCFLKDSPYYDAAYREKIVREYLDAFDEFGMTPVQSHEPASNPIGNDNGEFYFKKASLAMPMAGELGCPSYTVHPGKMNEGMLSRDEFISKNVASIGRLIPMAEKYGMMILVENIGAPGDGYYATNADELCELVDAFDHELVAANWDVGHANLNGCNQYESIKKLGKRLRGIHVHDNRGTISNATPFSCDLHLPPFMGNIDFEGVMRALKEIGYPGTLNFEVDYPNRPFFTADLITEYDRNLVKSGKALIKYYDEYQVK